MLFRSSALVCFGLVLAHSTTVAAQILPDATLPTSSRVIQNGLDYSIDAGTEVGENLFHSFQAFNLQTGSRVQFFTPDLGNIERIFARITGSDESFIDGVLSVNSSADLFLINPRGIVFGENSRLDLQGSFIASTARGISFENGSTFDALVPENSVLLHVGVPVGLQFGNSDAPLNTTAVAAPISVRGLGNKTVTDLTISFATIGISGEGLETLSGRTLALVGHGVNFEGGTLRSQGGRVHVASVNSGVVELAQDVLGWSLDYDSANVAGDIQFRQASGLDTGYFGGGELRVEANNILLDGSVFFTRVIEGNQPAGSLRINANDRFEMSGINPLTGAESLVIAGTITNATGVNAEINTGELVLQNGAIIATPAFGSGLAGNILINARDRVVLTGRSLAGNMNRSSLLASTFSTGAAGNIYIQTRDLSVLDGATIQVATFGSGNAGTVDIVASGTITVDGVDRFDAPSEIFARTEPLSVSIPGTTVVDATAGSVSLQSDRLIVDDGGRISADNQRVGVAGNLTIDADQIQVTREGALLAAATDGNLGNIVIQSQDLFLDQGGQISTDATLNATGGNISINTGTLVAFDNSDITANAVDNFGGRVIINAQGVFGTAFRSGLTPDSDITATSNLGASFGGLVSISTPDLDTSSGLVVLPTNTVDPNMLMVDTCAGSNQTSSFTVTSTNSLNENPLDRRLLRFPMLAVVQQLGANSDASETRSNAAILPTNEINIAVLNEAIAWKQVGQETVLTGTPTHQVAVSCEVLAQQL